jgi:hypothetical protein
MKMNISLADYFMSGVDRSVLRGLHGTRKPADPLQFFHRSLNRQQFFAHLLDAIYQLTYVYGWLVGAGHNAENNSTLGRKDRPGSVQTSSKGSCTALSACRPPGDLSNALLPSVCGGEHATAHVEFWDRPLVMT